MMTSFVSKSNQIACLEVDNIAKICVLTILDRTDRLGDVKKSSDSAKEMFVQFC